MIYFTRVWGNAKGGCSVTLGPRTIITGANGAGKSRVVNTLELAASGFASDIVGRPQVKRGIDLLTLAPEGEGLEARAETNTGVACSLDIGRAGEGKGKAPDHTPLYGITVTYPIRESVEALRGDVKKARDFVLSATPLKVTRKGIKKHLAEELHDLFDIYAAAHADVSPVELLQLIRDEAAKSARAATAGAKQAQGVIDSLSSDIGLDCPSDEDIEAGKVAVRAAAAEYEAATRMPEPVDLDSLRQSAQAEVQAYKEQEARLKEAEAVAGRPPNAMAQLQLSAIPLLAFYEGKGEQPCLLCMNGQIDGSAVTARIANLRGKVAEEQERAQAEQTLGWFRPRVEQAKGKALKAVNAYKAAEERAREQTVDPAARRQAVEAAYSKLRAAEAALQVLQAAKAKWGTLEDARLRIKSLKAEAKAAEGLAEAAVELLNTLVKKARAAFVENVQKYLPPTDKFDLVLQDGKREVCMFGFRRDGELHTALSGAEWARLTIALGAACMVGGDAELAILTPEERAFDPQTLTAVLAALNDAPGQVILTSPVEPTAVPPGWTHIRI